MSDTSSEIEEPTFYPTLRKNIVDAVTGIPTRFKVSSKDERRFWKVIDVSVFFRVKGRSKLQGAPVYFYTSPEAYERVQRLKVNGDLKQKWHARLHQYLAR